MPCYTQTLSLTSSTWNGTGTGPLPLQQIYASASNYPLHTDARNVTITILAGTSIPSTGMGLAIYDSLSGGFGIVGVAGGPTGSTPDNHRLVANSVGDSWQVNLNSGASYFNFTFNNANGTVSGITAMNVRIDYDAAPGQPPCSAGPGYCQYGTEPSSTAPLVTIVTSALVDAACAYLGAAWLSILFTPLIGWALDTGVLCGTGPPPLGTITPQNLLEDVEAKIAVLKSVLWYSLCQCKPGAFTPTPYPPPTPTSPTGWPVRPTYTCSDSDVCATLQLILRRLDDLGTQTSININQTTNVVTGPAGLAYTTGTAHAGLTGSGALSVSSLVGLRMDLTSSPPSLILPGNPNYLWDLGWMSVSDGGAMLQERRFTRESMEWFPFEMSLASTVGYFLKTGVQATLTELKSV